VVTSRTGDKCKYAGLHDLRRGFCTRWAKRVMPAVLRKLARHASIQTTLGYYVDLDAEALADELWAEYAPPANETGNTFGNIDPRTASRTEGSGDA
ncbi:MAG: site-specific integrase, partial [Thermogutta sp.]|nr:site-specific integrase [Thermogutta sp.]